MPLSTRTTSIILASGSPRRQQLLSALGLPFTMIASGVPEDVDPMLDPEHAMRVLAARKAAAVAETVPQGLVIGSDTGVVLGNLILGKPEDEADANRILRLLRGKPHRVITGLTVIDAASNEIAAGLVTTHVYMAAYSDEQIDAYVASFEPMDKAGAYAIQGLGSALVERIEGCYNNVVGFPLCQVAALLARFGVTPNAPQGRVCLLPDGAPCPELRSTTYRKISSGQT